jgi:hypothetical protein
MNKSLKTIIKNQQFSSQYEVDPVFASDLRSKLINNTTIMENKNNWIKYFWNFKFMSILSIMFITTIAFAIGFGYLAKPELTVAEAMERVKQTYQELMKDGNVLYSKSEGHFYNEDGDVVQIIEYENWEEVDNNRFKNISSMYNIDANGQKIKTSYSYAVNTHLQLQSYNETDEAKQLIIENYIFSNPENEGNMPVSRRILEMDELIEIYNIDKNSVSLSTNSIDGQSYYVFSMKNGGEQESLTKYYFDQETYLQKVLDNYRIIDGKEVLTSRYIYEIFESYPMSDELEQSLFVFDLDVPSDAEVFSKDIVVDGDGTLLNPPNEKEIMYDAEAEKQKIINDLISKGMYDESSRLFNFDKYSFVVPSDWEISFFMFKNHSITDVNGVGIQKGDYTFVIQSDLFITGGGFGYPFEQICDSRKKITTKNIEESKLERVNINFDLSQSDEECVQFFGNDQISPFWAGSAIEIQGSDNPLIGRQELLNNSKTEAGDYSDLISIKYEYKQNERYEDRKYPPIQDIDLIKMLEEMDQITKSVKFK